MNKNSVWYVLVWITILCVVFLVAGRLITAIGQYSEFVQWLVGRWGYPYFQTLSISMLLIFSIKVFSRFIRGVLAGAKSRIVRNLAHTLLRLAPGPSRHPVWKILLVCSLIATVASALLPNCMSANEVIVSFDVFQNGVLTDHISSGATIVHAPDGYIEFEANFETNQGDFTPPKMDCEWAAYTGDGRIVQGSNCKIGYRTGKDGNPDPVAMTVTQNGCSSSLGYFSFFVKNGVAP